MKIFSSSPNSPEKPLSRRLTPRIIRQLAALLLIQIAVYVAARAIVMLFHLPYSSLALPIDDRIPFLPWTVLIYYGCYIVWALNYTAALSTEPEGSHRFMIAEISGKLICFVIYLVFPTTLVRPEVAGSGFISAVVRFLYKTDAPDNLFPSIHCFVSWMCVVGLRGKPSVTKGYRIFSAFLAALVFVATLTTKQHVIVDVFAGVILAELCWWLAGKVDHRLRNRT